MAVRMGIDALAIMRLSGTIEGFVVSSTGIACSLSSECSSGIGSLSSALLAKKRETMSSVTSLPVAWIFAILDFDSAGVWSVGRASVVARNEQLRPRRIDEDSIGDLRWSIEMPISYTEMERYFRCCRSDL